LLFAAPLQELRVVLAGALVDGLGALPLRGGEVARLLRDGVLLVECFGPLPVQLLLFEILRASSTVC
jgi:hypothetical protein